MGLEPRLEYRSGETRDMPFYHCDMEHCKDAETMTARQKQVSNRVHKRGTSGTRNEKVDDDDRSQGRGDNNWEREYREKGGEIQRYERGREYDERGGE